MWLSKFYIFARKQKSKGVHTVPLRPYVGHSGIEGGTQWNTEILLGSVPPKAYL